MKHILKGILLLIVLTISWFLGIHLLHEGGTLEMLLFFLIAWVLGQAVYSLCRIIDRHF